MRNKNKPNRGQALVEFALVLPIFIFVIFGIIDFGRAFHCWTSLNYQCIQAVRAGTKRSNPLIARNVYTSTTHASADAIVQAFWKFQSPMMDKASYNLGNPDNNPIIIGAGTSASEVEVSATFDMVLFTPGMAGILGGQNKSGAITLRTSAKENKE